MGADPQSLRPSFEPPPRAFTQGVGTVFQFAGVGLFLVMMSTCCLSSLLGKETATDPARTRLGWHLPHDPVDAPTYSYARAMTLSVSLGVFFGMALAGIGLGLQAQRRRAPWAAVLCAAAGTVFWLTQTVFAIHPLRSVLLTLIGLALAGLFGVLLSLAIGAWREMRANPPAEGLEDLPADYQMPHSHLHADSPEARLAKELAERRQRLAVQQKEVEALEARLKRRLEHKDE
jgi:hypothetical protein